MTHIQPPPNHIAQNAHSPRKTVLAAQRLTKRYGARMAGGVTALADVSFGIFQGELISIVGPSGCGKSTLLRALAGLTRPTEGTLSIDGEPLRGPSSKAAMVFQQPVLLPWRTIIENVLLPIEFRALPIAPHRERAHALLHKVGLEGFENRYPYELSGGMQQRAAIVRALIQEPQILLMDEPFGALDAMTREQMTLDVLALWMETGKTIVFVTHSITEAIFLSQRIFVMTARPGRLTAIIDVDLPFPRTLDLVNTQRFGAYAAQVRTLLNAQGDLS